MIVGGAISVDASAGPDDDPAGTAVDSVSRRNSSWTKMRQKTRFTEFRESNAGANRLVERVDLNALFAGRAQSAH
jgi:hypothetical protein